MNKHHEVAFLPNLNIVVGQDSKNFKILAENYEKSSEKRFNAPSAIDCDLVVKLYCSTGEYHPYRKEPSEMKLIEADLARPSLGSPLNFRIPLQVVARGNRLSLHPSDSIIHLVRVKDQGKFLTVCHVRIEIDEDNKVWISITETPQVEIKRNKFYKIIVTNFEHGQFKDMIDKLYDTLKLRNGLDIKKEDAKKETVVEVN